MTWQPLTPVYLLIGAVLAFASVGSLRDRANPKRVTTFAFWGVLALMFLVGDLVPPAVVGAAVVAAALIAGFGGVGRGERGMPAEDARRTRAAALGNRLFVPALLIPLVTIALVLALRNVTSDGKPLLEPQHLTLVALAIACAVALVAACLVVRDTPRTAMRDARGLLDAIGWALVLPLVLATLGAVFAKAGVGELIATATTTVVPVDSRIACVVAFGLGMAVFTMIMGNAFAAFPVMMGGVGLPLLVQQHGADPASLAAIGMLTGYCGTLLTPMAANFNVVPAALLELRDPYGVIRAQVATAIPLFLANLCLMYFIAFR